MDKSPLAIAITSIIGITGAAMPSASMSATLSDGFYDMVINNTCYICGSYGVGSDGNWDSSFTFGSIPGGKSSTSNAMYDDTVASPVNGKYAGNPNDGVAGTIGIRVENGVITGTGQFEFDTIVGTAGGDLAIYGNSSGFTGSIDSSGNISLTPTGLLGTFGDFPSLVDERWNVDNFNGGIGTGTSWVANPPNSNTVYDSFSTGTATNNLGTINGAAYDGNRAILVKGGSYGSDWGGFFGAQYFEVWNVSFSCGRFYSCPLPPEVPIPAAVWLFGSGLFGLVGVAIRKRT